MSVKSETISDVFSAGIIFHYLLLNNSVFEGTKYSDILAQNRACDFNFEKEEYYKLDANAFELLKRMLEKRPELRITADEALRHSFFSETPVEKMEIEENIKAFPANLFK
jgi:calcium/calmodulin-dependent protein kinase I